jgi:KUP system potassium uptake protein
MISCVALVIGFQRSTALTAAYGIAVTGTMAITSILFYGVARSRWSWPWPRTAALVAGFLVVDLAFLGANLAKIDDGGWFPIAVALVLFTAMSTWKRGRELLQERVKSSTLSLDMFLADLAYSKPHRVPGTAVFMTSNPEGTPRTLLHHFKHNKVLHERVILLCVVTDRTPEVPPAQRLEISELGHDFFLVLGHYGFMETPDVPTIITECAQRGILRDLSDVSYYLGRETLIPTSQRGLAQWRKRLFAFLSQNARPATAFFDIPPNRVVELGVQIEL